MTDNSPPLSMQWNRANAAVADEMTDEVALIEAARCNTEAFAALYRRYVTPIYRYLYSRTGNDSDAQDLTAQVFLEALESLPRYRDRGNFAAWLFTIARRRAVDHYRRSPLMSLDDIDDLPAGSDPAVDTIDREAVEQLGALVAQLDDGQRELLRLRFAGGLTFQQIGVVQGRSAAAVSRREYVLADSLTQPAMLSTYERIVRHQQTLSTMGITAPDRLYGGYPIVRGVESYSGESDPTEAMADLRRHLENPVQVLSLRPADSPADVIFDQIELAYTPWNGDAIHPIVIYHLTGHSSDQRYTLTYYLKATP